MPNRRKYTVSLDVPEGATSDDCKAYILEAVSTWRGQCRPPQSYSEDDPGDPFWSLNTETITVKRGRG